MQRTQKETLLLQDLKSHEQLCIEKYRKYAGRACDEQLKNLFSSIGKTRADPPGHDHADDARNRAHDGGGGQQQARPRPSTCAEAEKQEDAYLCKDAPSTEKHVSSVYDACIFEFKDKQMRDTLNHIQKEEQEHGKPHLRLHGRKRHVRVNAFTVIQPAR